MNFCVDVKLDFCGLDITKMERRFVGPRFVVQMLQGSKGIDTMVFDHPAEQCPKIEILLTESFDCPLSL